MEWIQGVERQHNGFQLVFVSAAGERRLGPLKNIRSKATRNGNTALQFADLELAQAQVVPGCEYVNYSGLRGCNGQGQKVFALQAQGMRLMMPAATVLLGLFGTLIPYGSKPLEAQSLDRFFVHTLEGDESKITFAKDSNVGKYADATWFIERLRWMSAFPSGREFWSSIYQHALEGELGLSMPAVRITGHVVGRTLAGSFYASRLNVDSLTPLENPLPFATALRGRTFNVLLPAAVRPTLRDRDDSILRGTQGWSLSDFEWEEVVAPLLSSWSLGTGRARLDAILEKLATGERFQPSFVSGSAATWFGTLKRSGKWDEVKSALMEFRRGGSRNQLVSPREKQASTGGQRLDRGARSTKLQND